MGYHALSDFRCQLAGVIDGLITQTLALLMQQDLVELNRVAQVGTRVRAGARAASFRRDQTLQALMREARAHLEEVIKQAADPAIGARLAAARKRGAAERLARLEAGLKRLHEVIQTKKRGDGKAAQARVSTSDPEVRVLKLGASDFRPAFNVQFATTTDRAGAIVGVDVTNFGSAMGESTAMLTRIEQRTGVRPREILVDGGYPRPTALDQAVELGVTVPAPLPKPRAGKPRDPQLPREDDSEVVAALRTRMARDEAEQTYEQRAATAETVNSDANAHLGLEDLVVRGLCRALGSACLSALTHNTPRLIALRGCPIDGRQPGRRSALAHPASSSSRHPEQALALSRRIQRA